MTAWNVARNKHLLFLTLPLGAHPAEEFPSVDTLIEELEAIPTITNEPILQGLPGLQILYHELKSAVGEQLPAL